MAAYALFFLSGVASLVLEGVFRRQVTLLVGSSAAATAVTLATFLGGLASGAALFGRRADRIARPLRLYGLLEIGVGATGAAAVALLAFGREALLAPVRTVGTGVAGDVVAGLVAAAVLLPPTVLMGGSFPALARFAARRERRILGPVSRLYAANTLGGSLGVLAAGFVVFEAAGIAETGWLGAGLAAAVGVAALGLDRPGRADPPALPASKPAPSEPSAPRRAAAVAAALGGAAALGLEVVWTRLLALPMRSYTYSFSLMLSLFLLGIVMGSALVPRLARSLRDPMGALAIVQGVAGLYVAASVLWTPALLAAPLTGTGFGAFVANGVLAAAPVVLPPTLLSGMALPLAIRAYATDIERTGSDVGIVYAANTAGSIAGALLAGLVLLPAIGAARSLAVCGVLAASAGAVAARAAAGSPRARRAVPVVALACLAALVVPPRGYRAAFARAGGSQARPSDVLYVREGVDDTVAVVRRHYGFRDPDAKSVIVNGIAMTATVKPVWRYMAAEGHLPALFAPTPTRALLVCVGTGITLGALASHRSVVSVEAVDLSGAMLGALPLFDRENGGIERSPKVRIVHADGRHVLELERRRYEAITLEPPPPVVAGSVHLYTAEFYGLCRKRLAPGGVVAQWLPLHAQSLASARATARTFLAAFPYAQLWLPSVRDAVLLGSDRPLRLDPARLRRAYADPRTRANLEAAYLETPEALVGTFLLDRAGIARWATGADLVTDDRPWMEFFRRYGATMGEGDIVTLLDLPPAPLDDVLAPGADPAFLTRVAAEREAHRLYLRAEIARDPAGARRAALASAATRFRLYGFGCDAPQLEALRAASSGGEAWRRQVAMCEALR